MPEADFKSAVYRLRNSMQATSGFIELEHYAQALSSLEVHIVEAQALAELLRQQERAKVGTGSDASGSHEH